MQRVSTEEEGYDFSKITHGHWKEHTKVAEYFFIIILMLLPTVCFNLLLWSTNDFLIAHILYQILLIFLIYLYHFSIKKLNFDVYYIHEVRNINTQVKKGIILIILFALIIPGALILAKYLDLKFANDLQLLMPSGIEPKSVFPKIMHITYMVFFFIEYCLFMPLVEFRYYLIFLQYRINNVCTTFWIFIFMVLNNFYYTLLQIGSGNFQLFGAYIIGVLLMYGLMFRSKSKFGIVTTILQQIGINIGVWISLALILFSKSIVNNPKNPEMFSERNAFDFTFQIFFTRDEPTRV